MGKQQHSAEFKFEAVTKVARELGIKPTTLHGWVSKYKDSHEEQLSN